MSWTFTSHPNLLTHLEHYGESHFDSYKDISNKKARYYTALKYLENSSTASSQEEIPRQHSDHYSKTPPRLFTKKKSQTEKNTHPYKRTARLPSSTISPK